jgi:hypothetical protein
MTDFGGKIFAGNRFIPPLTHVFGDLLIFLFRNLQIHPPTKYSVNNLSTYCNGFDESIPWQRREKHLVA